QLHDLLGHEVEHLVDGGGANFGRKFITDVTGVIAIDARRAMVGGAGRLARSGSFAFGFDPWGGRGAHAALAAFGRLVVRGLLLLGKPLTGILGKTRRSVEFTVGADSTWKVRDLVGFDQLPADLGHKLAADCKLFRHPAVRPVVVKLELDFDGTAPLATRQRKTVEQVDARDEVERVGEGALDDLGLDRSLA